MAEQISAMLSDTMHVKILVTIHPQTMPVGPPVYNPNANIRDNDGMTETAVKLSEKFMNADSP
jgi:hypothetical protein